MIEEKIRERITALQAMRDEFVRVRVPMQLGHYEATIAELERLLPEPEPADRPDEAGQA